MWTHFSLNKQAYRKSFKPKGTIFPCGYEVFANMDETMMERIKNLAKLLGKLIHIPAHEHVNIFWAIIAENDSWKYHLREAFIIIIIGIDWHASYI